MADEDDVQALEAQFFAQLQTRTSSVNQSLRASKPVEALRVALQDAPLASKDASLKQANYEKYITIV